MGLLGGATSREVASSGVTTVLVPVGSCEQHGPHLPLDTDTRIAVALSTTAAVGFADCVVAPAIPIGASGEHRGFPGTLSIGTDVLAQVLVEIARSVDWARSIVFVNGHGGNLDATRRAVELLDSEGRRVSSWSPSLPDHPRADSHAGWVETSVMLALDPGSVRTDHLEPGDARSLAETLPIMRVHGVAGISANGVLGDPRSASAVDGTTIFDRWVDELVAHLRRVTSAD